MNKIIALRGKSNTGKTTSIKMLCDLLLQNDYQVISSEIYGNDIIAILSQKEKLIGVTTFGDTYAMMNNCLQKLMKANCNICICACRTIGWTITDFGNYKNQFYNKTVNYNAEDMRDVNMKDAQILFSLINGLINEKLVENRVA